MHITLKISQVYKGIGTLSTRYYQLFVVFGSSCFKLYLSWGGFLALLIYE